MKLEQSLVLVIQPKGTSAPGSEVDLSNTNGRIQDSPSSVGRSRKMRRRSHRSFATKQGVPVSFQSAPGEICDLPRHLSITARFSFCRRCVCPSCGDGVPGKDVEGSNTTCVNKYETRSQSVSATSGNRRSVSQTMLCRYWPVSLSQHLRTQLKHLEAKKELWGHNETSSHNVFFP